MKFFIELSPIEGACPSSWVKSSNGTVNICVPANTSAGCYSVIYSVNGISYQRVCGKVSA